jgi:hypothetical protein
MAKEYLEKLSSLVNALNIEADIASPMEVKHFFSGAALYVNGVICASWSPVGLAFKLPEGEVAVLIDSGRAKPLKYFPKGHIKKGYALFADPDLSKQKQWRKYFLIAAQQT